MLISRTTSIVRSKVRATSGALLSSPEANAMSACRNLRVAHRPRTIRASTRQNTKALPWQPGALDTQSPHA